MATSELMARYSETRNRLRNPPNAVPDIPIDMKKLRSPFVPDATDQQPKLSTEITIAPQVIPEINNHAQIQGEIARLELAIDRLRARLADLKEPLPEAEPIVFIKDIIRVVCREIGVSRAEMLADRRQKSIVNARHIVFWLAKTLTARSLPEIGRLAGNRDHTTVLHGIRRIERLRHEDEVIHNYIERCMAVLKGCQR